MPRAADRHDEIVNTIRRAIVANRFPAGSRLPTRQEIERRYGASSATVQRVFDTLRRDGFIEARGRLGTFVAAKPPHRHRYAIVFNSAPGQRMWGQFHTAVFQEAGSMADDNATVAIYLNVNENRRGEGYERLAEDIAAGRLAGVLFHTPPYGLEGTPIIEVKGLPRVAIMSDAQLPGVAAIHLDQNSWLEKAAKCLAKADRRRVAIFSAEQGEEARRRFSRVCQRHNLQTCDLWQHVFCLCPSASRSLRLAAEMLFRLPPAERPNALLLLDDNFVPSATAGLRATGIAIPGDLLVIAHANFPYPTASAVPTQRLGFDARRIIAEARRIIDAWRAGQHIPPMMRLEAEFEEDETNAAPLLLPQALPERRCAAIKVCGL